MKHIVSRTSRKFAFKMCFPQILKISPVNPSADMYSKKRDSIYTSYYPNVVYRHYQAFWFNFRLN